ncbi:MAG: UDP-N-acetylmuramate--L-alanine ligase [Clostridia bacterium]|nr:UDP-N-acetylmuramate--L-alanine ligase [Clostridia bacterium]
MIGIGGSGMYPIAEILHSEGYILSGSDNNETDTLARVRALNIPVTMGHFEQNVEGADLVIYSAAIMKTNPELVAAEKLGIPTMERSKALGAITRRYNNVIGVCGTHGKTTVSSMITQILVENDFDPSAVIGGRLPLINSNGRAGESDIMVCESCEYVDTFLQLSPDVCVLLNIDCDHMEYFKTLERLMQSFTQFANSAHTVIVNGNDENSLKAMETVDKNIITYGITDNCDYYAANIKGGTKTAGEYDLMYKGQLLCHVVLNVPGDHNISNSVAAAAAAHVTGATGEQIASSLANFKGAGRRFEILGTVDGITIADDYAHHPKELEVTLKSAMKMGYNKVYAVFQPFTFSRTKLLLDDFASVLQIADQAVLSEIMGSREINTYGIHTTDLVEKIPGAVWFDSFEKIADYIVENAKDGDLVITLGCGDIYKAAKIMLKKLKGEC